MSRRVAVRGIVLYEGKLLCVRLKSYKDHLKRDNAYWCLPGGGLDAGESLVDGAKREMLEETGIEASVGKLLYVQQFQHEAVEYLEFFFHITNSEDYISIDLSQTTHGLEEIEKIEFIDPTTERVLPTFLSTESIADHVKNYTAPRIISRLSN